VLGHDLSQGVRVVVGDHEVEPDLGQQRYAPGQAEVGVDTGNGLTELAAETPDLGHSQSVHPVVHQGLDHLVQLLGPDDGGDQFHGHMLRMRWNLRMSSLPASSAAAVTSRMAHAVTLSAVPAMCFIVRALLFRPGRDGPG